MGKHLKLNDKMEKGVISPSLLRLTLDEGKITSKYFEYLWDMYMLHLMKKEARNACLVHLPSAKVIGEIDIPVPPLDLQNRFAAFVEQVDKSKFDAALILQERIEGMRTLIQQSLEETKRQFDALMQGYFK